MTSQHPEAATKAWMSTLWDLNRRGVDRSPRGQPTIEIPQHTMAVLMQYPVISSPTRKLSTKFMAAEAHWIITGDNRVETIAPYNKHITQFSDDGVTFFGAYGPKIVAQLDYVVNKLNEDPHSRQAGLTLWRENPPSTKDVPCTVAMFFGVDVKERTLNMHVFMRSSDVWLGVPYDVFNFSMVAMLVCAELNKTRCEEDELSPGALYITAASRHLYLRDAEKAVEVLERDPQHPVQGPVPRVLWTRPFAVTETLIAIRDGDRAARWWEQSP